jgi:hypothetical protein
LTSLGVHEHWNNATDKKYTRNLSSSGTGIELVSSRPSAISSSVKPKMSAQGLKIVQHASKTEIVTDGAFSKASVSIYNTSGSLIRHYSRNAGAGSSGRLIWDNRSDNGYPAAPGMYTVTAQIAGCQVSGMAMIVR